MTTSAPTPTFLAARAQHVPPAAHRRKRAAMSDETRVDREALILAAAQGIARGHRTDPSLDALVMWGAEAEDAIDAVLALLPTPVPRRPQPATNEEGE